MSKPDFDRLLNKAFQAPSVGGGCVIPITVPYCPMICFGTFDVEYMSIAFSKETVTHVKTTYRQHALSIYPFQRPLAIRLLEF